MSLARKLFSFTGLFALGISTAIAQGVPQSIADCASQKKDATRLACFDREVAKLTQSAKSVVSTPVSPTVPRPSAPSVAIEQHKSVSPQEDEFGVSGDLARKRADAKKPVDTPLPELHASVTGVKSKPYGELVFELDNGQVWEQTEKKSTYIIKAGEQVVINQHRFGSFFLTTASGAVCRVRRTR